MQAAAKCENTSHGSTQTIQYFIQAWKMNLEDPKVTLLTAGIALLIG